MQIRKDGQINIGFTRAPLFNGGWSADRKGTFWHNRVVQDNRVSRNYCAGSNNRSVKDDCS
jgi:hypothetical protein